MIRYSLACDSGHRFESWFHDSAAYDDLVGRQLVLCPTCESDKVAKTVMAPALIARAASPDGPAAHGSVDVALVDPERRELRDRVRAFRDKVMASTQDVGPRFPEEARRMHEGEVPHRDIRGQATREEARALLEDGVFILPLPPVPDDLN